MSAETHPTSDPTSESGKTAGPGMVRGLEQALIDLAVLGETGGTMPELGRNVDEILAKIMHLPNLFLALIDENPPRVRFVYCRDVHDRHVDRPVDGLGLTDRVYLTQRSLLIQRPRANALLESGELVNHGVPSLVWLGVPLWSGERIIGVMATQDYHDADNLTAEHEACFKAVAPTIAGLMERSVRQSQILGGAEGEHKRVRQKKALFATIGHDVRSPLAVIQGYSDLLRGSLSNPSSALTAERIFKAAQELSKATDRMLDYTSAETGADLTEPEATDLGGWMRSLSSWTESLGDSENIGTEFCMTASGNEHAKLDAERLRQLLQHVVRVAFSVEKVSRVKLWLRVQPVVTIPTGLLRLSFGIESKLSPGALTNRTDADSRLRTVDLDDGRTYDGVSVSLAIAERLAAMLGADLRVSAGYAAPWRAAVVLTVPAVIFDSVPADDQRSGAMTVMRESLKQHAGKMVVLDAATDSRAHLVSVIGEAVGGVPDIVASVAELAPRIEEGKLSVIIAAVENGPVGVREIALALRAVEGAPVLPYLIAVSKDQSPAGVESLLDSGADAYVPRPVHGSAMLVALSDAWLEHERRLEQADS